jgi:hypothetical protein
MDFPFRNYTSKELLSEFNKLRHQPNLELKRSRVGYKCSNAFFQYERMLASSMSKVNGVDFWRTNKKYIKAYCKKGGSKDLFNAIQFLNHIPAQFTPSIAAYIYGFSALKTSLIRSRVGAIDV